MLQVIRQAISHSIGIETPTAFAAWQGIYERQDAWAKSENIAPLLAHFGTSLVERALIESVCRATSKTLGQALRDGTLGFQPGAIHPALAKRSALELLPRSPLASVVPRHTVGLADPLSVDTIPNDEKLDDSLPQSLDQCIHAYGLRHFKIKITGDIDADLERLRTVAAAIDKHAPATMHSVSMATSSSNPSTTSANTGFVWQTTQPWSLFFNISSLSSNHCTATSHSKSQSRRGSITGRAAPRSSLMNPMPQSNVYPQRWISATPGRVIKTARAFSRGSPTPAYSTLGVRLDTRPS